MPEFFCSKSGACLCPFQRELFELNYPWRGALRCKKEAKKVSLITYRYFEFCEIFKKFVFNVLPFNLAARRLSANTGVNL